MSRVVVTGVGVVTGLGASADETWTGLMAGRSAIGPITSFDASSLRAQLGAEFVDFAPQKYVTKENRRQLRMMTRNDQLALAGADLAVQDAGLVVAQDEAERAAVFVGSDKEIADPNHLRDAFLASREDDGTIDVQRFGKEAQSSVYPLFFVEGLQGASIFYISQQYGLKGANTYFSGTADAGATAIGRAYRTIKRGEADVAIAGGFAAPVNWWTMGKMESLGLLSTEACRPFDRDRSGTVLGEGTAMLVLEERERAVARGVRIYAEVTGYGSSFDTYGTLTPDPDGRSVSQAVGAALREADVGADRVGYVVAHGSGTREGDRSEARGLRAALGGAPAAVSSVKAATGHLLGGAGALNAAVAVLAVHHRAVPPTLNLEHRDPACDLDIVTGTGRDVAVDHALAVSRALTGQNVALLFAHDH